MNGQQAWNYQSALSERPCSLLDFVKGRAVVTVTGVTLSCPLSPLSRS